MSLGGFTFDIGYQQQYHLNTFSINSFLNYRNLINKSITTMFTIVNKPLRQVLKHMNIQKPLIPVHSNVNGKIYRDANHIRKVLPKQIFSPVKWEQTLHILYDRTKESSYPNTYECGPGSSLKTILKMVNKKAEENTFSIKA